jgi:hypothetical protein
LAGGLGGLARRSQEYLELDSERPRRGLDTCAGESRAAREVQREKRKAMDPIAYITVTDHEGTVLKRVSIANRDVQNEIDMVGSSFRDRGGLDPFHMVVRAFEDDLAKAMETAWSQAT